MWKVLILFLFRLFAYVQSAPMTKENAMTYLENYGYMPMKDGDNFREAMMNFQSFMGLRVTGEMDEESDRTMKMPRCGMTDMKLNKIGQRRMRRYTLQGSRWRSSQLTYKVTKYSNRIKREIVDKELKEAFDTWTKYTNISFALKNSGFVDIEVGFFSGDHNDGGPFDGPGSVLAHAYYPIFGGDIHFDESEDWTTQQDEGINFKQVAIHEIGHSLGLRHSDQRTAIMFPTFNGYIPDVRLQEDDIRGITKLYTWRYGRYSG